MKFFGSIHTRNLLNLFLAFIVLLCLNNMIYPFLQHVSYFLCVSSLNLLAFMPYAMYNAQIYIPTCSYVQIYMLRVLCHVFLCFLPLFVLGRCQGYMLTCLYDVVGYALLGSMCFMYLFPCYMVRSLSSHAYMFGFMFFHVYVLSFYMFTCMFLCLYVQIYVLTCLCAWIYVLYMFYAIFHVLVCPMPCLCAQTQAMFVMPCAFVAILSLCLSLLCFGLMVGT